ncbi:hypothetical protein B484DRAFT_453664 [Ochromonadaceae sp. CCMP2298]|nr:hypothetical protein B484DRAFT_453664 [Ochromonadaceae sp. CCMP2298]
MFVRVWGGRGRREPCRSRVCRRGPFTSRYPNKKGNWAIEEGRRIVACPTLLLRHHCHKALDWLVGRQVRRARGGESARAVSSRCLEELVVAVSSVCRSGRGSQCRREERRSGGSWRNRGVGVGAGAAAADVDAHAQSVAPSSFIVPLPSQ